MRVLYKAPGAQKRMVSNVNALVKVYSWTSNCTGIENSLLGVSTSFVFFLGIAGLLKERHQEVLGDFVYCQQLCC